MKNKNQETMDVRILDGLYRLLESKKDNTPPSLNEEELKILNSLYDFIGHRIGESNNDEGDNFEVERLKFQFISMIEESKQIRSEFLSIQESMRRMSYYSILVGGVALTFLVNAFSSTGTQVQDYIPFGFLFIALIYGLLCFNYLGLARGLLHLSNYHVSYLTPLIVDITQSEKKVFQWLIYIREKRKSILNSMGYFLKFLSELGLILIPSIFSMILFNVAYLKLGWNNTYCYLIDGIYIVVFIVVIIWFYLTVKQFQKLNFNPNE